MGAQTTPTAPNRLQMPHPSSPSLLEYLACWSTWASRKLPAAVMTARSVISRARCLRLRRSRNSSALARRPVAAGR